MKTDVSPPVPPLCTTLRPGTVLRTSGTVRRYCCSISCDVITVTELAISVLGVGSAVGLTTTSSGWTPLDVVARGARRCVGGLTSMPGNSMVTGCCA